MEKIPFNPNEEGGLETARMLVLERLRHDKKWHQFEYDARKFAPYVKYIGNETQGMRKLIMLIQQVQWELIFQGVITPGYNSSNLFLPWFRITEYGHKVLTEDVCLPHDPIRYIERFPQITDISDKTVEYYLLESLNCFTKGNLTASVVMLGVASERVFLLLCENIKDNLSNDKEQKKFGKILKNNSIKPKQDWVLNKIRQIPKHTKKQLPEDIETTLIGIFNFIRSQRNDLGHPREHPPSTTREVAYTNLRLFPSYCKNIMTFIKFLSTNTI